MTVSIDQSLDSRDIWRISDAQLIQLVDEAARKRVLKATPRDDDTFLNDEKGCLFLLTAMPQSFKRLINPFHNVFSRQPALVGRAPHRHGHLCGEGVLIPGQEFFQQLAHDDF